jgi:phage gp29-like protein
MAILDAQGQPLRLADLKTPQTASVGAALNASRWLAPGLRGLSPANIRTRLQAADNGDLYQQHRLFADMLDADAHLRAEFDKRNQAIIQANWRIEPPRNASAAEKRLARWAEDVLRGGRAPVEDLFAALLDATAHGFAACELDWQAQAINGETVLLPAWSARPQEWFRLDRATRSALRLVDGSFEGAPLRPFTWVWHMAGQAKTGYGGRHGLLRCLVWPFVYKHYALGDFAQYLETFGLPIITGKHPASATEAEKDSLYAAVVALGHDARAIMPAEMSIEIAKVAGGGGSGEAAHLAMVNTCEKAMSKAILGGTLTSQADGKTSTNALGIVHNEVRNEIAQADARNLAATIKRDLLYPLLALNKGLAELTRCPSIVFEFDDSEDMQVLADALPKLAPVLPIPSAWAYAQLGIPAPEEGEAVLAAPTAKNAGQVTPPVQTLRQALAASLPTQPWPPASPVQETRLTAQLESVAIPAWEAVVDQVKALVAAHSDLASLQSALVDAYGGLEDADLQRIMAAALALATLKGMADAR